MYISIANAETYLCITDNATGFDASDDWNLKQFIGDEKYLIRPAKQSDVDKALFVAEANGYVVTTFGKDEQTAWCEEHTWHKNGKIDISDFWNCNGSINFAFDISTLRFYATTGGHYTKNDSTGSDAYLAIGKCTKI